MANITVTFADGQPHTYNNVPDNITPDQIEQRAGKDFAGRKVQHIDRQAQQEQSDIQKTGNMLANTGGAILEPIMAMGSGMFAKPVADIAGLAATASEIVSPSGGDPAAFRQHVLNKFSYTPKTTAGQAVTNYNPLALVGKASGWAGNKLGELAGSQGENPSFGRGVAEAVPQAIGIASVKYAPQIMKTVKTSLRGGAENLMQSALKPTLKTLKNGDAAVAIDTMLNKGINVSPGGLAKLRDNIDLLNDQISEVIASSPAKVDVAPIAIPLVEKLKQFKMQVNPNADINTLRETWNEFQNHPSIDALSIPIQLAQKLKQGTYQQLNKKYGEMGSASIEGQKALARGLKEGIVKQAPEISTLNADETSMIKTLGVAERRILMDANKNPMGLALLAKNPAAWAAFMADRSPLFKSLVARTLNATQNSLPAGNIWNAGAAIPSEPKNRLAELMK